MTHQKQQKLRMVILLRQHLTHTLSVLAAIFPGEPGLAGCPRNSPSPFYSWTAYPFGTGLNFPCHS